MASWKCLHARCPASVDDSTAKKDTKIEKKLKLAYTDKPTELGKSPPPALLLLPPPLVLPSSPSSGLTLSAQYPSQ